MKSLIILFTCSLLAGFSFAQDLSGVWEGTLSQNEKSKTFYYQIQIEGNGGIISGTSFSVDEESDIRAEFTLTGAWDGNQLVLQEIDQIAPASPKWCLKYMTLDLKTENGVSLSGPWKADGCKPGRIELKPQKNRLNLPVAENPESFSMEGTWTGFLYQEDRNYGFYYEITMEQDEAGSSYIVSEDNGGSARIRLNWYYNKEKEEVIIKERAVQEKTDDNWPWCIKSAKLLLAKKKDRYVLEGDWLGFIEGFTQKSGPCAPGKMVLERLIPTEQIIAQREKTTLPYEKSTDRAVKVERVLEVQSPNIRIKVWDNGIVDGDVVTLFLNGKQLLENHRVKKTKYGMNVKLNDAINFLILHAEDLGDITPNTVAVSVDDGVKEQIIILSSNLKESGAVMIKEFKVD